MLQKCGRWILVVGCVAALSVGCDRGEGLETPGQAEQTVLPEPDDEPAPAPSGFPSGTVDGDSFAARGVLAQRDADGRVEIRMYNRPVSCETFDADIESRGGEPIVIVHLDWPKPVGDTLPLRASLVDERLQFCRGRDSGTTSCKARSSEQGSLTVVESRPQAGALSFDVTSRNGNLSGRVDFTVCR